MSSLIGVKRVPPYDVTNLPGSRPFGRTGDLANSADFFACAGRVPTAGTGTHGPGFYHLRRQGEAARLSRRLAGTSPTSPRCGRDGSLRGTSPGGASFLQKL